MLLKTLTINVRWSRPYAFNNLDEMKKICEFRKKKFKLLVEMSNALQPC